MTLMLAMQRSTLGPRGSILRGDDVGPTRGGVILMLGALAVAGTFTAVMYHYASKYEREGYGKTRTFRRRR